MTSIKLAGTETDRCWAWQWPDEHDPEEGEGTHFDTQEKAQKEADAYPTQTWRMTSHGYLPSVVQLDGPCFTVTCGLCDYRLDTDEDGEHHHLSEAEARSQALAYGWVQLETREGAESLLCTECVEAVDGRTTNGDKL